MVPRPFLTPGAVPSIRPANWAAYSCFPSPFRACLACSCCDSNPAPNTEKAKPGQRSDSKKSSAQAAPFLGLQKGCRSLSSPKSAAQMEGWIFSRRATERCLGDCRGVRYRTKNSATNSVSAPVAGNQVLPKNYPASNQPPRVPAEWPHDLRLRNTSDSPGPGEERDGYVHDNPQGADWERATVCWSRPKMMGQRPEAARQRAFFFASVPAQCDAQIISRASDILTLGTISIASSLLSHVLPTRSRFSPLAGPSRNFAARIEHECIGNKFMTHPL